VIHELKTWPEPFAAVLAGLKRHEVRKNDRNFKAGDSLLLREYDPATKEYTGRRACVFVDYVSYGGKFGLPKSLCVMSISGRGMLI
jgi:hypothetical protein